MTFVWPYIKGPSWWNKTGLWHEIKWSIATVRKFYKGAECVVIGDDPECDVEWIPIKRKFVNTEVDVRHYDIIHKLEVACERFDEFVMMYDDVFFLHKMTRRDVTTPYALCKIDDLATYNRGKGGLLYSRLWDLTYKKVAEITDELYDWETHLPRYFESDKLKFVMDAFDIKHNNLIISSIYGAMYLENPVLLDKNPQIRAHIDAMGPGIDLEKVFKSKFLVLDDNALTPKMTEKIEKIAK